MKWHGLGSQVRITWQAKSGWLERQALGLMQPGRWLALQQERLPSSKRPI